MRISDWSSDVCSSDLYVPNPQGRCHYTGDNDPRGRARDRQSWRRKSGPPQISESRALRHLATKIGTPRFWIWTSPMSRRAPCSSSGRGCAAGNRSEEHTSELQSLMRISYAVFCLKKKTHNRAETRSRSPELANPHNLSQRNSTP